MRRPRIFVEQALQPDLNVELPQDKAHYLRHVLRLQSGQPIVLFNGEALLDFEAQIYISGKQVCAHITQQTEKHNDPDIRIDLLQAAGKNEAMDFIVQKATELGISSVTFFNSERTQTHLQAARADKKLRHWQAVSASACEQSDRNRLPTISLLPSLNACLELHPSEANRIVMAFNGESLAQVATKLDSELSFQLLVGPEGGLTEQEIGLAHEHGFIGARFGPRVLRMETAALAGIALLQHRFGDM